MTAMNLNSVENVNNNHVLFNYEFNINKITKNLNISNVLINVITTNVKLKKK